MPKDQVYALICLDDAGTDLESFKLQSWREAGNVLYQIVEICAAAEQARQFEVSVPSTERVLDARLTENHQHRDLHWGNVLVRRITESPSLEHALAGLALVRKSSTGQAKLTGGRALDNQKLEVTLIDFTLSRATPIAGDVVYDAFEDKSIFGGEGRSIEVETFLKLKLCFPPGDDQFDVYRSMRDLVQDDWQGFHPLTTVMVCPGRARSSLEQTD